MEYVTIGELNFLGLMPCPLKVPFEELFNSYIRDRQEKNGVTFRCLIESNANNHTDFFSHLDSCQQIGELPDIMMAPGFNHFFHGSFREKFIDKGFFAGVGSREVNSDIGHLGLQDPDGHYNIPCFNPTVMLVDRTNHKHLPIPCRWEDLLRPEYECSVALRGQLDRNFCEGLILNIYKEHGEDGVRRLGKATKMGVHPSQMVKLAGSGKLEAPAVSTIPYSFAKLVRPSETVTVVWPEDGAIVNPLVMLVKNKELSQAQEIAEFLAGKEVGRIFSVASFPSYHPQVDNELPSGAQFKWLGWDFIKENDLSSLMKKLEAIFLKAYLEEKQ